MTVAVDALTAEQEQKIEQLAAAVESILKDQPHLRLFTTRSCYVRYLRARSWDVKRASKMLKETLAWRLEFKPEQIRWSDVRSEALTGKLHVLPQLDLAGRPIVLMRPRNEQSTDNVTKIKWLVYAFENASKRADSLAGEGKMTWLVDFDGYTRKSAPPLKVSLQTLSILQNHYPERLGKAICYHAPRLFSITYSAIKPFIDPTTAAKIAFFNRDSGEEQNRTDMGQFFDMALLDKDLGGELDTVFDLGQLEQRSLAYDADMDAVLADIAAAPTGN